MSDATRKNFLIPESTVSGKVSPKLLPQLLTISPEAPRSDNWLHEIKHDGYRMTINIIDGQVRLWIRRGYDWTHRFPGLVQSFEALGLDHGALDGELVCLDAEGKTDFAVLQSCLASRKEEPILYLFDLVYLEGVDLSRLPLLDRKEKVRTLLEAQVNPAYSPLRYSDHVLGEGPTVFAHACHHGLEGIAPNGSTRLTGPGKEAGTG